MGGIVFNGKGAGGSTQTKPYVRSSPCQPNRGLQPPISERKGTHPSLLADALLAAYRVSRHGVWSSSSAIFNRWTEEAETYLAQLGRFNLVYGVHVFDELEQNFLSQANTR